MTIRHRLAEMLRRAADAIDDVQVVMLVANPRYIRDQAASREHPPSPFAEFWDYIAGSADSRISVRLGEQSGDHYAPTNKDYPEA